jgi:hypothetical protein
MATGRAEEASAVVAEAIRTVPTVSTTVNERRLLMASSRFPAVVTMLNRINSYKASISSKSPKWNLADAAAAPDSFDELE